jgi:UDP-GlcNAc:undecaprenyl-phosphate GlcNAc-1-phosphate transferase
MVLLPPLIRYAVLLGLVDVPDDRKVHSGSMPRVGGVAIVIGTMLSVVFLSGYDPLFIPYIAAVVVLFIFGILDDRGNLDYRWKFLGQIVAAGLVTIGGNTVIGVLPFFGFDPLPQYITVPLTILVLVGVTNAINLADGLDGLAAGTTFMSVAVIALLAYFSDGQGVLLVSLAVCGSLLGFLRYNAYPAKVFMGDTGSQFLGFTAGYIAIELTQNINPALNPALPLLILGLPLLDTFLVMSKRVKDGRSVFYPDKNHLHHQLLGRGLDHAEAVAVIYMIHGLFVFSAIMFRYYSDLFVVSLYVTSTLLVVYAMFLFGRIGWGRTGRGQRPSFSDFIEQYRVGEYLSLLATAIVKYGLAVFLVLGALFAREISKDIGVIAVILAIVMLPRLVFARRLKFIPLRLFMYISVANVLYLVSIFSLDEFVFSASVQTAYFISMAVACLFSISRAKSFVISTTDLLVLLMVLVMVFLPDVLAVGTNLEGAFLKLVVLFYACELVVSSMQSQWNVSVISSLLAFTIIAFRGLV